MITESKKQLLFSAWRYCDDEDKSTEFMLQYMADIANVTYEEVIEFISSEENQKKYQEL